MIFADKLILLRKNSSWTQEELAEQMNVTRQSVSKWEGAQSVPDLQKIIKLAELFSVSTDYLLKDEIEEYDGICISDNSSELKKVSMEVAHSFLSIKKKTAKFIALAIFLFIISPITLISLTSVAKNNIYNLSEGTLIGIGLIVLFILNAFGVGITLLYNSKLSDFKYLSYESFETEYGVSGMVKERKNKYKRTYTKNTIIGIILCILSPIPLFVSFMINENNEPLIINMVSITLFITGIGVFLLVNANSVWESFKIILQEENYTKDKKENKSSSTNISSIYWGVVFAIFLGYSLFTNDWQRSWIVWPIAGVLFAPFLNLINIIKKNKK